MINKYGLLIGLVILLSACGQPESATPAPTPQAINVFFPPALQPWADKLGVCAAGNPLVGLYFMPSFISKSSLQSNDVALELGDPSTQDGSLSLSQVAWEQVVVIVNQQNKSSQLTLAELRSIFTGQSEKWNFGNQEPIQEWVFPKGDPLRMIFDNVLMTGYSLTTEAMLAPDQTAMLEAIGNNVSAIGYVTESYISSADPTKSEKVKIIPLVDTVEALRQPVVAITASKPQGLLRDLLVCLQSNAP